MTGINNLRLKKDKLKFTTDYKISPIYQPIRDIDKQGIKFGDPDIQNFEPLLQEYFNIYQSLKQYAYA
jgi:hypothetical protein